MEDSQVAMEARRTAESCTGGGAIIIDSLSLHAALEAEQ